MCIAFHREQPFHWFAFSTTNKRTSEINEIIQARRAARLLDNDNARLTRISREYSVKKRGRLMSRIRELGGLQSGGKFVYRNSQITLLNRVYARRNCAFSWPTLSRICLATVLRGHGLYSASRSARTVLFHRFLSRVSRSRLSLIACCTHVRDGRLLARSFKICLATR